MTDKDREAFEKWFPAGRELLEYPNSGDAPTGFKAGWQARAAHDAPKLTEQEVVHQVARAIHNACAELKKPYPTAIPCYSMNKNKAGWEVMAKAALRAAGIQFKEEASSNPEPGSCQ